jgi:tRNA threonylcarbamoyl adenosine modification protein YjeE
MSLNALTLVQTEQALKHTIFLPSADQTTLLAAAFTPYLSAGSVILLHGPVGAGKTHFARQFILTCLSKIETSEDVPSPTFTLVQTYDIGRAEIWHADLYRLSNPSEAYELGLEAAFDTAICLVEWPDRLGDAKPKSALHLTIEISEDDSRIATLEWTDPIWTATVQAVQRNLDQGTRETLLQNFLAKTPWSNAERKALIADASGRSYERLTMGADTAILMNAPHEMGEDVRPFVAVTDMLVGFGLAPPRILAQDITQGFLLLEDLGNGLFARLCETSPALETPMYSAAINVLAELHKHSAPSSLPPYDLQTYLREVQLLTTWYMPTIIGELSSTLQSEFDEIAQETFAQIPTNHPILVMRDYHAENLLWLPDRARLKRVGLLDYQDALAGHPAYDLVSLLEDARRDTSPELRAEMISKYLETSNQDTDAFISAYSLLGAQRNLKIIGIFARLSLRDGKAHYVDLIPRVWEHLMRDLQHPACEKLSSWVAKNVPPPSTANLQKLRCAK